MSFSKDSGWPFEVSECSQYLHTGFTPLYEMRDIAWHITPEPRVRVGFDNPTIDVKVVKPGDETHNDGLSDYD